VIARTRITPEGLAVHTWRARQASTATPIVLVHGWGNDSRCWQTLLPGLREQWDVIAVDLPGFGDSHAATSFELNSLLAGLESCLPDRFLLIGWSLGGTVATALAARIPHRIDAFITLATNACFVANEQWPHAMAPVVNQQFNHAFDEQPALTLKRFAGLMAQGGTDERHLLKTLRQALVPDAINPCWSQALRVLADQDNRAALETLSMPVMHLLAECDALVPAGVADALLQLNPAHKVIVIPGAAHALPWYAPLANYITDFFSEVVLSANAVLDKRRVAEGFSRAATTYDSVASLQRDVADHLLEQIAPGSPLTNVLDLGCGTGYSLPALQLLAQPSQLFAADLAEGMLGYARATRRVDARWVCADAESLPFTAQSLDLIFSSLALQWCDNPDRLFSEVQRVLATNGHILFATLGPGTLQELRDAWRQVDNDVHVNHFIDESHLRASLTRAGLTVVSWQTQWRQLSYKTLSMLTGELKTLGAHNRNPGQANGLTGRQKIRRLHEAYEHFRIDGNLPATYEVYYVVATRQDSVSL